MPQKPYTYTKQVWIGTKNSWRSQLNSPQLSETELRRNIRLFVHNDPKTHVPGTSISMSVSLSRLSLPLFRFGFIYKFTGIFLFLCCKVSFGSRVSEKFWSIVTMALESESQKKSYGVFGDVYGVMMVPKELEIEKDASIDQFRFQFPDLKQAFQVSLVLFFRFTFFVGCVCWPRNLRKIMIFIFWLFFFFSSFSTGCV